MKNPKSNGNIARRKMLKHLSPFLPRTKTKHNIKAFSFTLGIDFLYYSFIFMIYMKREKILSLNTPTIYVWEQNVFVFSFYADDTWVRLAKSILLHKEVKEKLDQVLFSKAKTLSLKNNQRNCFFQIISLEAPMFEKIGQKSFLNSNALRN